MGDTLRRIQYFQIAVLILQQSISLNNRSYACAVDVIYAAQIQKEGCLSRIYQLLYRVEENVVVFVRREPANHFDEINIAYFLCATFRWTSTAGHQSTPESTPESTGIAAFY